MGWMNTAHLLMGFLRGLKLTSRRPRRCGFGTAQHYAGGVFFFFKTRSDASMKVIVNKKEHIS